MNDQTKFDPLTCAYIGYGLRQAIANGMETEYDALCGEDGLMQRLVDCAPLLDAEWDRRYGEDGVVPHGAHFVFSYEIAEPFGERFAKMLVEDADATPDELIKQLFREADPEFVEPELPPGFDLAAIKAELTEYTVKHVLTDPDCLKRICQNGFTALDRRPDDELVALYRAVFDKEPPMTPSTADAELQAAA